MSKESLDYKKLCSNYYSSWEEGCCMESCEFYNHDECPVVYVNGLISDLEAKLAESEEQLNNSEQKCLICNKYQENEQLKQQLADRDKEITKLKTLIDAIDKYGQYDKNAENLVLLNPENYYSNGHKLIIKTDKQDKISFAVERLEKVKRAFIDVAWEDVDFAIEIIDNQIKQLKEGK